MQNHFINGLHNIQKSNLISVFFSFSHFLSSIKPCTPCNPEVICCKMSKELDIKLNSYSQ